MLKSAVIGLGQMGLMYDFDAKRDKPSSHALAYHLNKDFLLSGAVDPRKEQSEPLSLLAPEAIYYPSVEDMLTSHQELDVVSICTPPVDRLQLVRQLLDIPSLRVIFCEKPLAGSLPEAEEIVRLLNASNKLMVPNLSRRWNPGIIRMKTSLHQKTYGELQKIHVRYTRGIYNTGSHLFDLIRFVGCTISSVQVVQKVATSSDLDGEPSFSFCFETDEKVSGFAEAIDDTQYYLFEVDFYCKAGKIEFRHSGNEIRYYKADAHPLFSGFQDLRLEHIETSLLAHSNLASAVAHLSDVINNGVAPACTVADAVAPLYVAEALVRSYQNNGVKEKVGV